MLFEAGLGCEINKLARVFAPREEKERFVEGVRTRESNDDNEPRKK